MIAPEPKATCLSVLENRHTPRRSCGGGGGGTCRGQEGDVDVCTATWTYHENPARVYSRYWRDHSVGVNLAPLPSPWVRCQPDSHRRLDSILLFPCHINIKVTSPPPATKKETDRQTDRQPYKSQSSYTPPPPMPPRTGNANAMQCLMTKKKRRVPSLPHMFLYL